MSTAPVTTNGRNGIARKAQLAAVHLVFGTRRWTERQVAEFARGLHGKRVLEIGSGPPDPDEKYLAWTKLFDSSNDFVQSDVDAEYGHRVVDVTTMEIENEFDVILCLYVLEHVYAVEEACRRMHRALQPGGTAIVAVPHLYPYHDEPGDFWRFTEHSLRRLLEPFESVEIRSRGPRRLPQALIAFARK
jgi:SAM-dependent methyltransferase